MPRGHKVLVTGAGGFTGKYLIAKLDMLGHESKRVSEIFHRAGIDVRDKERVMSFFWEHKPSKVVHLAGLASTQHPDSNELWSVNYEGTKNVLNALSSFSTDEKHFILASTSQVYKSDTEPLSEASTVEPVGHYARSKFAAEEATLDYSSIMKVTIIRPFNYTGIGQSTNFLIPKLVQAFQDGLVQIKLGNTHVSRDFSDIRDVATAYAQALELVDTGEVLNICSGVPTSVDSIIQELEQIYERGIRVDVDQSLVRDDDASVLFGDSSKIRAKLRWQPLFQIKDTLRWISGRDLGTHAK